MRLLFPMDAQNYDPAWRVFQRDSARAILLRGGRAAMIYSRKYAYYKFPGGGIEPSEAPVQALLRETEEEAGLRILPQSIREYGCVRRIQKSDSGATEIFRQDNLYYLCEAAEDTVCQRLDAYESDEGFTLEWVDPFHAITVNRRHAHGPADPAMLEREALVLEALIREAWLPSGDPQRLSPARLSSRYAVRPLTRADIPAHYALSSRNTLFYEYHKPFVTEQSILEDLSALPPGKQAADKFYLGFSDGANIAMLFTLLHPELVEKLILNGGNLSPSGICPSVQLPIELGYRIARLFAGRSPEARKHAELLGLMVNEPHIPPETLSALTMPVLVLAGTRDMVKRRHTEQIAASLPNAQLQFLNGDHFLAAKEPAAFNEAVLRFLREA